MRVKYVVIAAASLLVMLLVAAAALAWRVRTYGGDCESASSAEAGATFAAEYAGHPEQIATIVEGAGVVRRGYAATPAALRTPDLTDAIQAYVTNPTVLPRFAHPCTTPPS